MLPVCCGSLSCTHWCQEFLRLSTAYTAGAGKAGLYIVVGTVPQPVPVWGDVGD